MRMATSEPPVRPGGHRGDRCGGPSWSATAPRSAETVEAELQAEGWTSGRAEAQRTAGGSRARLRRRKKDGVTIGLLHKPGIEPWDEFTCLNSLREVEPTVNLILDDGGLDDEADFVRRGRGRRGRGGDR